MVEDHREFSKSEKNQSMRESRVGKRYFKVDAGYDKAVYENTYGNWFRIFGTFAVFYTIVAFYWWACYSLGVRDITAATWIYIAVFLTAVIIILSLIIVGHFSNKKLIKYEKLMIEVNEEKKKRREEEEKKQKREEAQKEMDGLKKVDDSEFDDSRNHDKSSRPTPDRSEDAANDSEDEGSSPKSSNQV